MRDLYDIYEDGGITATPGNTTGMGNPTPPTDGEVGSEPMCGKGKCKREKKKKKVDESILGSTKGKVSNTKTVLDAAEWLTNTSSWSKVKCDDVYQSILSQIIDNGDGTIDIDTTKAKKSIISLDVLEIPAEGIPDWLKIRNVIVGHTTMDIHSLTPELSNLNWTIKTNKGLGVMHLAVKSSTPCILTVGPVKCEEMTIFSRKAETLHILDGAAIEELNLSNCQGLRFCTGIPKNTKYTSFTESFIQEFCQDKKLVPKGCIVQIK
jgi:hypothetical protein